MAGFELSEHSVEDWLAFVERGEVRLPTFQRDMVWTHQKTEDLLEAILRQKPVGCLLLLRVDSKESALFESRRIEGSSATGDESYKYQLLDGQQRVTSLWRSLMDRDPARKYLVKMTPEGDERLVQSFKRSKDGASSWLDDPQRTLAQGFVPVHLLRYSQEQRDEVNAWVDEAVGGDDVKLEELRRLESWIGGHSEKIRNFQMPALELLEGTTREEAIDVFIQTNTSSTRLTKFDIVESRMTRKKQRSLRAARDLVYSEVENVDRFLSEKQTGELLLRVACLRQGLAPTESRFEHDDVMKDITDNLEAIADGIRRTLVLLEEECVFDKKRLPSAVPLRVLPSLYSRLPDSGDRASAVKKTLRAYLWRAFVTDRYASAAATTLKADHDALAEVVAGDSARTEVPIFDEREYPLPDTGQLLQAPWPGRQGRLPRALLAMSFRLGARDLASDERVRASNVGSRDYHHVFPKALLRAKIRDVTDSRCDLGLNCILIDRGTNRRLAAKPPMHYLRERAQGVAAGSTVTEADIKSRVESHGLPYERLAAADTETVGRSYGAFLRDRAQLFAEATRALAEGEDWP